MLDRLHENTEIESQLSIDDVLHIIGTLSQEVQQDESPAQREFSGFIRYWLRGQMRGQRYRELVDRTRQDIYELVGAASPDEMGDLLGIIHEEARSMRANMGHLLAQDIMRIYSAMSPIERKSIDKLLQNPRISKSIPVGIVLLLKHIETMNDKKSEWIRSAMGHVHSMSENISSIRSKTKGTTSYKDMVFGQFMDMYQETLVAISAIACHIYSEDCSVIMQPVKVKCSGASPRDISQYIDALAKFLSSKQKGLPRGYFPGLGQYLQNQENRDTLTRGKYVYIPLVVDAKDILLYLRTMDDFFASWNRSLEKKTQDKFHILKNTVAEASIKGVQPRIKFQYKTGKGGQEFNIRLDYVRGNIEMDIGGVDFNLQNGGTIVDYLIRQDRPIIANSYALGGNTDTSRIANDSGLALEEKMALIHSAMMEQGLDILGRDESRMFGYHFLLREGLSEPDFTQLQGMF